MSFKVIEKYLITTGQKYNLSVQQTSLHDLTISVA